MHWLAGWFLNFAEIDCIGLFPKCIHLSFCTLRKAPSFYIPSRAPVFYTFLGRLHFTLSVGLHFTLCGIKAPVYTLWPACVYYTLCRESVFYTLCRAPVFYTLRPACVYYTLCRESVLYSPCRASVFYILSRESVFYILSVGRLYFTVPVGRL